MIRDTYKPIYSSFLSCEKDAEAIIKKLFVDNPEHAKTLKKLLIINNSDCLDNDCDAYKKIVNEKTIADMISEGYIKLSPKIKAKEFEELKSYIIISFDNFTPCATTEIEFRDCMINFDVICHTDAWEIGDYRLRPLKIVGYIDGLLNECRLSGLGTLHFAGCNELIINEELAGYTLTYAAVHGSDDIIPSE